MGMGRRRQSNISLPSRMYLNHGAYYFVDHLNKWHRLSKDYNEACGKWAQLMSISPNADTVAAVIHRYMNDVAPKKAPRTYKDNQAEAKNLIAAFGKMPPASVKPMHVAQYLDIRGLQAPVRANREKSLLSHIFSQAMRWGVIDSNPCKGVARNYETKRDRYISDGEFEAVRTMAGDLIAVVMEFAYRTALRRGDILSLRLDQIKTEGIYVKQGKTGKKMLFEWTPELNEAVSAARSLPRPIRGLYLFCNRRGQPYTDSGFKGMWQKVQVRALAINVINERFTFHDIRAKALTDAKRAGMDATLLAGHSSSAMTDDYIKAREVEKVTPLRKNIRQSPK